MQKFILVVPSSDSDRFFLNKNYTNMLKNSPMPYYMCDYNYSCIHNENIAGVLLTGGGDIDPSIYSQKKHIDTNNINLKRDIFEIKLIKTAYKLGIPIFGICKGIQSINVAFGGTITQHIDGHNQLEDRNIATHLVQISKESMLYNIINKTEIYTNSIHHQVIDKLADNFKAVGTTSGVIEAIECVDKFILGVQWHPEALQDINSQKIFDYFIKMAQTYVEEK